MAFSHVLNVESPISLTDSSDAIYRLITTIQAGWGAGAIRMSGDGDALYSSSGSVFTLGQAFPTTPGSAGNSNAWFVVGAPDDSYFLCYQRTNSYGAGEFLAAVFSTTPFTGGTATVRATSPTEVVFTQSTTRRLVMGGPLSGRGVITHGIFGDADEEYSFAVINYIGGRQMPQNNSSVATGGCFVDVCPPSFINEGHVNRFAVCPFIDPAQFDVGGATVSPLTFTSYTLSSGYVAGFGFDSREPYQVMWLTQPITMGTTTRSFAATRFGWDARTTDHTTPVWVSWDSGRAVSMVKGTSRLFKLSTTPSRSVTEGRAGRMGLTPDHEWWYLGADGHLMIKWDGVTDPLLAPTT